MPSVRRNLPLALLAVLVTAPALAGPDWPAAWSLGSSVREALPPSRWSFDSFLERLGRAEEPAALVDRYLGAQRRIPVAEKDGRVHFLYRGEGAEVDITGPMLADPATPERLERIAGTDLFFRSYDYDPKGVWSYRFIVDGASPVPDELNPRRALSDEEWSEVTMPDWREPSFLRSRPAVPSGGWETFTLNSEVLARSLEIEIYLPPEYFGPLDEEESRKIKRRLRREKESSEAAGGEGGEEGEAAAVVAEGAESAEARVVLEGWDKRFPLILIAGGRPWGEYGQVKNVLDNLFNLRVQPAIVALLPEVAGPSGGQIGLGDYADFVEREAVPALDERYRTLADPAQRAIVGAGSDGSAALFVGLRGAGAVRGVGSLSPTPLAEVAGLAGQATGAESRVFLSWSRYEPAPAEGDGAVLAADLAEQLRDRGHATSGGEVVAGPGWRSWRAQAADMLRFLFPRPPPLPELLLRTAVVGARATLRVSVDAPSKVVIDAGEPFELQPGEVHEEGVDTGTRRVVASSLEAPEAIWNEPIEVTEPNSEAEVEVAMLKTLRVLRRGQRGTGLYRDTDAGLMWTRSDNGQDVRWEEAGEYCDSTTFAGFADWRLPTMDELKSLQAIWSRATYKTVAKIKPSACCSWSSELEGDTRAWSFNFRHRRPVLSHRSYSLDLRALCVRGFDPDAAQSPL